MSTSDTGMFKTGDLVIGNSDPNKSVYSATGQKLVPEGVVIYGSETALKDQRNEFVTSVMRGGGVPLTTQLTKTATKKTRHSKAKNYYSQKMSVEEYLDMSNEPQAPPQSVKQAEIKLETVQFENSFGKIKAKVEYVVEHPQAYMLVFSDEDSMVFEPKTGETLLLHTSNNYQSVSVYYPGVTFDSPDSNKKFMILFKAQQEEQE